MPARHRLSLTLTLGFCSLLFSSCGGKGDRVEIAETRSSSKLGQLPRIDVADAERFGIAPPPPPQAPTEHPFVWSLPEGWSPAPESQMRIINASFGSEDAAGECYVTVLPGGGGGALANINRWRGQISQPPIAAADLDSLEKRSLLGAQAHYIDVSGNYKGMGSEAKSNYRLVGVLHEFPQLTAFVKMTGPADLIGAELENFRSFCESIQFRSREQGQ